REAFRDASIPELQHALKTETPQTRYLVLDDLIKRRARKDGVATLNEMLRDRSGGPRHKAYGSWNSEVRSLLKRINEPVTFARDENSHAERASDKLACEEWEIDLRGNTLVSSGGFSVGQEIIDGLSRPAAAD